MLANAGVLYLISEVQKEIHTFHSPETASPTEAEHLECEDDIGRQGFDDSGLANHRRRSSDSPYNLVRRLINGIATLVTATAVGHGA